MWIFLTSLSIIIIQSVVIITGLYNRKATMEMIHFKIIFIYYNVKYYQE